MNNTSNTRLKRNRFTFNSMKNVSVNLPNDSNIPKDFPEILTIYWKNVYNSQTPIQAAWLMYDARN